MTLQKRPSGWSHEAANRHRMKQVWTLGAVVALGACSCGQGNAPLGQACSQDSDCASGNCYGTFDSPQGRCDCTKDSDCPPGGRCANTGDVGNDCFFSSPQLCSVSQGGIGPPGTATDAGDIQECFSGEMCLQGTDGGWACISVIDGG
jgi:hypothetical protein